MKKFKEKIESIVAKAEEFGLKIEGPGLKPKTDKKAKQHIQDIDIEKRNSLSLRIAEQVLAQSEVIWNFAIVSLPLDYLLLHFNLGAYLNISEFSFPLLIICVVIAFLFSYESLVRNIFQNIYKVSSEKTIIKKIALIAGVFIIGCAFLLSIGSMETDALLSIVVQIVIYGSAIFSFFYHSDQNKNQHSIEIIIKRDFFIGNILPIICSRLVLPLGLLSAPTGILHSGTYSVPLLYALCLFLLFENAPRREKFFSLCARCSSQIPMQLFESPVCTRCYQREHKKA